MPQNATATVLRPPIPPKIRRVSERPILVKALIYGEPGAGKTYLACTAPKPLVLLTEPSVSDATMQAVHRDLGADPGVWDIDTLEDLEMAYEYLEGGKHEYETVVVDSLTDLYRRLMKTVVDAAVSRRSNHDPDVPEQGDWLRVQEKLRYIVRLFRDLPMNVVFTALVMDIRDEMRRVPFIQPKGLALEIPAFFNLVGCLKAVDDNGKTTRKLLVEQTETYVAKNPGGTLPPVVENPNLTTLFGQIKGGLKKNEVTA